MGAGILARVYPATLEVLKVLNKVVIGSVAFAAAVALTGCGG
jgi:hypothetical protein